MQNLHGPVTQKMEGTWSREGNSMSKYHYIIVHPLIEVYNETKGELWAGSVLHSFQIQSTFCGSLFS